MPSRRRFLKQAASLFALPFTAQFLSSCNNGEGHAHITGRIIGANHKTGHMLRSGKFPAATKSVETDVLIIGGGISGLSAKRWLHQKGLTNVMLLEMDDKVGGNSIGGQNAASAYPWGAHYLPIPDNANVELLAFLQSIGTITSFNEQGLPLYSEYHLCHDPEERLWINGHWQEGLVPHFGISDGDKEQITRFLSAVEQLKTSVGTDGKPHFNIPIDASSSDDTYRKLDAISFDQYLTDNGYTSAHLRWYLEYCCKDDYGSTLQQTSAWAGLHYFASRRGKAANAASSAVLTWPEGNAFLMNHLQKQAGNDMHTNMLAHSIRQTDTGVEVLCYDVVNNTGITITAKKALLCTPQYVTKHILGNLHTLSIPSYAPWMVANITLSAMPPHTAGTPLCWDNVIYGQESVGYVYANHQNLSMPKKGVITYYLPITANDPAVARNTVYKHTYEMWRDRVLQDLSFAHPSIEKCISNIDVWIWGHGMIRPAPGYIWGAGRQAAMQPINNKVFFAHTDLSGISVFEEGFYQGIRAAEQIMRAI